MKRIRYIVFGFFLSFLLIGCGEVAEKSFQMNQNNINVDKENNDTHVLPKEPTNMVDSRETSDEAVGAQKQELLGKNEKNQEIVSSDNNEQKQKNVVPVEGVYEGLIYMIDGGRVTIIGIEDYYMEEVIIPSEIDGYPVTNLADAFYGCYSLKNVKIPSSVTNIGECAFASCKLLENIEIPDSVRSIGESAFDGCWSLKSVVIPKSVTNIGDDAFNHCILLKNVEIQGNITNMGKNAFSNTPWLEQQYDENGLAIVGNVLLHSCNSSADSISIPNEVTCIAGRAFYKDESIVSLEIPDSVTSIGKSAFQGCRNLVNIKIPNGVKYIGDETFAGCIKLETVELPSDVKEIGKAAFYNCRSLKNIEIPKSVTCIEEDTFWLCQSLNSIEIPDGVTRIGRQAFAECDNLEHISISDKVTSIGENAFLETPWFEEQCKSELVIISNILIACNSDEESIVIPNGVVSIGISAFQECNKLISLKLPEGLINIGDYAFCACENLSYIEIPHSVTNIGRSVFDGTPWLEGQYDDSGLAIINNCLVACEETVTEITIPEGVTQICKEIFWGCEDLLFVEIPNSVISIDQLGISREATLSVEANSYAHIYAYENDYKYILR